MTTEPLPRPVPPLNPVPAAGARIALIGPPAAGKSTIGRLLAERLDIPLRDTDAMIVAEYGSIEDIFATKGEARFREIEREVVRKALRQLLDRPGVVSLGGGAILNPGTRAQLKHPSIKVITIMISSDTARVRLGGTRRPLLDDDTDPVAAWEALVEERTPLYESVSTTWLCASNEPPSTVVNRVVDVLTKLQREEEYARFDHDDER